jgi:arylsulfatase
MTRPLPTARTGLMLDLRATLQGSRRAVNPRKPTVPIAQFFAIVLAALFVICAARDARSAERPRPNIVLILADDIGFSDAGCYGGEIQTPHLDALARDGLRFSQFYNCALCGPSRAALMTGLYPHQAGVTNWTGVLTNRCVTIAESLKRAGYTTGAVGRLDMLTAETWHNPTNLVRHVDRFLGSTGRLGPGNYFMPVRNTDFFRNGEPFTPPPGVYKTDLITDFAVEFIAEAATRAQPFFLYFAHYAPHWPLHAKPADIAKYRDLYRRLGWDDARAERHRRLLREGLIPESCRLSPRDTRAPAWTAAKDREWEAERMAVFAAQVDALDQSVGRVLDALRRAKVDDNTLVLFLSDNGASDTVSVASVDKPGRTWRTDNTPTRFGSVPSIQPGPAENFVTAGPAWSNVSNAPFRNHKATNHEGGIASPLIARWPAVIREHGKISHELSHITDIAATCLDVAGVAYPGDFSARKPHPPIGRSLVPVFEGKARTGHESLCWSTSGARAVRAGPWKLVSEKGKNWELYNLDRDRAELDNLAASDPSRVQSLENIFRAWSSSAPAR